MALKIRMKAKSADIVVINFFYNYRLEPVLAPGERYRIPFL